MRKSYFGLVLALLLALPLLFSMPVIGADTGVDLGSAVTMQSMSGAENFSDAIKAADFKSPTFTPVLGGTAIHGSLGLHTSLENIGNLATAPRALALRIWQHEHSATCMDTYTITAIAQEEMPYGVPLTLRM